MFRLSIFASLILSSTSVYGADRFADESKLHWRVSVEKDGDQKNYSGAQIDKLLKEGINHKDLKINCEMRLLRKMVKYDPSGKNGYTRDEEQVTTQCSYGDSQLELEAVVCADGKGKGNVGTTFSDKTQVKIVKADKSFFLKVSCIKK